MERSEKRRRGAATGGKGVERRSAGAASRRAFLSGAAAAALGFSIVEPRLAFGTAANSKLRLGMIGCGKRGTRVAGLFGEHGGFEIRAGADYFRDRVDAFGERFAIPAERRFTTLSAYQELLAGDVDAVAIECPPYFHAIHAAAAVKAGKHVYLAKPVAVDVPGCLTIAESGRQARERKQCFLVDFQTRADPLFQEALRRVHAGAIGRFAFGESSYHAGCPWKHQIGDLRADPRNPENRLRAWGLDRDLSGDIITEQNVHTIDVASWIMGHPPLYAAGTGGRKVRDDPGNCWDHFALVYQYPDGVGLTFSSRQFEGHGSPGGINNRMFGSRGVLETQYGGQVLIRGEEPYPGGKTTGIYNDGIRNNIRAFHDAIRGGDFSNSTVDPSVRSTLTTILGREAAYRGERVYWHQLVRSRRRVEPDLEGLEA